MFILSHWGHWMNPTLVTDYKLFIYLWASRNELRWVDEGWVEPDFALLLLPKLVFLLPVVFTGCEGHKCPSATRDTPVFRRLSRRNPRRVPFLFRPFSAGHAWTWLALRLSSGDVRLKAPASPPFICFGCGDLLFPKDFQSPPLPEAAGLTRGPTLLGPGRLPPLLLHWATLPEASASIWDGSSAELAGGFVPFLLLLLHLLLFFEAHPAMASFFPDGIPARFSCPSWDSDDPRMKPFWVSSSCDGTPFWLLAAQDCGAIYSIAKVLTREFIDELQRFSCSSGIFTSWRCLISPNVSSVSRSSKFFSFFFWVGN